MENVNDEVRMTRTELMAFFREVKCGEVWIDTAEACRIMNIQRLTVNRMLEDPLTNLVVKKKEGKTTKRMFLLSSVIDEKNRRNNRKIYIINMEVKGKYLGSRTIEFTGKDGQQYKKTKFWIDTTSNGFENKNEFEFFGDKLTLPDSSGGMLSVKFNLKGREYLDKEGKKQFFQSVVAWEVQQYGNRNINTASAQGVPSAPVPVPVPGKSVVPEEVQSDDLPF